MRRLYLSLVLMALASLFFLGWTLDQFQDSDAEPSHQNEYQIYFDLMEGFAQQAEGLSTLKLAEQVSTWQRLYQLPITLHHINELALPPELEQALQGDGGLLLESDQRPYLVRSLVAHPEHQLYLDLPKIASHSTLDLGLTLAFYIGAGLLMALWLLPLTRRLSLIHKMATEFGKGNLASRVPQSRFSYIHWIEGSFNRMAAQIEQLIAENRMLASGLSHDLRTPLACLRFGVDAALDAPTPEQKDNMLLRMEQDLDQMEQMVTAFLDFAGLEKKRDQLQQTRLTLNELIVDIERQAQVLAKQQNKDFVVINHTHGVELMADKVWLTRAVLNIVANGVRFAKQQVGLTFYVRGAHLVLTIEDDGPGIAVANWQHVFKPFVRLEASRNREQGHYGLGLAIAQKVCEWHDGEIKLQQPIQLSGCCFCLTIPIQA
ncbi:sensor histidine kinase [Motilimonas eburnea]|uniref:sensor histidine kinase n=1 Tax=Motilimonas eburnea TaxID=1737488 RepID=UPI001E28E7C3|nr:ATP-binding protein [Motilimonas eburnea]MCE2570902.1 two-component sensor histidine kinase [Motilimonas eburnea]